MISELLQVARRIHVQLYQLKLVWYFVRSGKSWEIVGKILNFVLKMNTGTYLITLKTFPFCGCGQKIGYRKS